MDTVKEIGFYIWNSVPTIICLAFMWWWFKKNKDEFQKKIDKDPFEEYDEPGTATGIGILGTFVGITFGLLFFNTSDVIRSVPWLLAGMKAAFFTSIAGMLMNFWFKRRQHRAQDQYYKNVKPQPEPANIATLIEYLKEKDEENEARMSNLMGLVRESNESLGNGLNESIQAMTDSIVGTGQHTLNSELQRGFERTCDTLDSFQANYLKKQTKQFATAMNIVVKHFNDNLEKQCGESFVAFNQAVSELTKWQQDYMNKLKTVGDQQTEFAGKISSINEAIAGVETAITNLGSKTMDLQKISSLAQQDYTMIQQSMEKVAASAEDFKTLAPVVEQLKQNMDTTASTMQQMNQTQYEALTKELSTIKEELQATVQGLSQMSQNQQEKFIEMSQAQQEKFMQMSQEQQDKFKQVLEQEIQNLGDILRQQNGKAADALSRDVLKSVQDTNERICEISAKMTEDLNIRVNESLQALGSALAQVSEKFVDDYTPLAEKLEEVVLLANKLQISQQNGSRKEGNQ